MGNSYRGKAAYTEGIHTHIVRSVAYSADGARIAFGSYDRTVVRVWDARTGEELSVLRGHTGWIVSLACREGVQRPASSGIVVQVRGLESDRKFTANWVYSNQSGAERPSKHQVTHVLNLKTALKVPATEPHTFSGPRHQSSSSRPSYFLAY